MVCAYSYDLVANCILFVRFASLSACSFPLMLVWALTLSIVVGCVRCVNMSTMDCNMVLSAWLFCRVWCRIWVFMT